MASVYKCETCGVVANEAGHLCDSKQIAGKFDYCGQDFETQNTTMCKSMRKRLRFECSTCGRPSEKPDMVCRPIKVHG
ncbi:MAG: hypothetical protein GWN87_11625 [Desulfuromonadales bacterium]|nr:hypothetical protein [Desulfuromonadales bacterium]NIS41074.1 hypothetical protein [Desulfuromonadales bacterium]